MRIVILERDGKHQTNTHTYMVDKETMIALDALIRNTQNLSSKQMITENKVNVVYSVTIKCPKCELGYDPTKHNECPVCNMFPDRHNEYLESEKKR